MGEHFSSTCVIVAGLFFGGIGFAAAAEAPPPASIDSCITYDATSGEPLIDAGCFFQMLVTRYRDLAFYEDVSHVLRVTRRSGEEPQSVETEIGCEIADGKLRVQTPRSQALDLFGLQGLVPPIEPSERAGVQYDLWLAPHLVPRFAQDGHASDADEASQYTAMTAEAVTLDEKPMILLAVERAVDADPETSATLDLYVDPESMLVERAEHRQTLPDGASYETTVEITRQTARTKAEVVEAEQGGADSEESDRESRDDLPAAVPDEQPVTQSIDPRHSDR